mgnify:CR=1 FL=1
MRVAPLGRELDEEAVEAKAGGARMSVIMLWRAWRTGLLLSSAQQLINLPDDALLVLGGLHYAPIACGGLLDGDVPDLEGLQERALL